MSMYCCVPGCGNNSEISNQTKSTTGVLKFYNLSLNTNRDLIQNLNIREYQQVEYYCVCSDHFYQQQQQDTYALGNGYAPSINDSENTAPFNSNKLIMTSNCCIIGCKYNHKRRALNNAQLYSLPSDTHLCMKWCEFINRNSIRPLLASLTKTSKICQLHFTQDDFLPNKTLKSNAIPTIFMLDDELTSESNYSAVLNPLNNNQLYFYPSQSHTQQSTLNCPPVNPNAPSASTINDTDDSNESSSEDSEESSADHTDESLSIDLESVTPTKCDKDVKQEESPNSRAKRLGLTDVINKLHKQHSLSSISPPTQSSQILSPPPKIPPKPPLNKSEMDLYKLLERANLTQYFNSFTEQGGDDLNQLLEASDEEFKEIMDLVCMSSKPLHVKRLKKVIDEYKSVMNSSTSDDAQKHLQHSPTTNSSGYSSNSAKTSTHLNESIRNTDSPPLAIDFSSKRRSPSSHSSIASESGSDEVMNESSLVHGENASFNSKNEQNEKNVKKSKVIELYNQGERCVRKLSQLTGVPLTTVYRVIGKIKGINYNIPRGNGAGRKTILDSQDREVLVEILRQDPKISRKALGKELEKRTGKSVHNSTLNRELCRLRHYGQQQSPNTLQTNSEQVPPQVPATKLQQASKKDSQANKQESKQTAKQIAKPQVAQPTPSSTVSATLANSPTIVPNQAMLAAAAMMYPHHQHQFPFPPTALAAYQSYLNQQHQLQHQQQQQQPLVDLSQNNQQTLDELIIQKLTLEVKKFADTLPKLECKPVGQIPHDVATQLMELQTISPDNEQGKREIIRRVVAALTRFDLKKTFYEQCLFEVSVQLCCLKPNLLTRREELLNFGRQLLKHLNILETNKRLSNASDTASNNSKRAKIDFSQTANEFAHPPAPQAVPPNPFGFYFNNQYASTPTPQALLPHMNNSKLFWPFGAERGEIQPPPPQQQQHTLVKHEPATSTSTDDDDDDDEDENDNDDSESNSNDDSSVNDTKTTKLDTNNNKQKQYAQ